MNTELEKIYILDDIIPIDYQNFLLNYYSHFRGWDLCGLSPFTTYNLENNEFSYDLFDKDCPIHKQIEEDHQIVSRAFDASQNFFNNENYSVVLPILHYLQKHLSYSFLYEVFRIKANFQYQRSNKNSEKICPPHVDLEPVHENDYTLLYYFCDSDGDTIIFDKTYYDIPIKNINILKKITPKKGRCLLFPAKYFHSGNFPIHSKYRMVLNINFKMIDYL